MGTQISAKPRRKRNGSRDVLAGDGNRIRMRLSPADSALLDALRGEDESDADAIRRLIRTAGLFSTVSAQVDQVAERLALMEVRGLVPAPMLVDAEGGGAETAEPDPVVAQKAAIAGFLADDDEDDEDDEEE